MFEDYLNHRCNIYHLEEKAVTVGYGIKAAAVKEPNTVPDLTDVRCHFHVKNNNQIQVVQNEPFRSVEGTIKLTLPFVTDIRLNDIVEDCRDGLQYRAGIPRAVHDDHHLIVTLYRLDGTEAAI